MRIGTVLACLVLGGVAHAGGAADFVRDGEELARQGRFTEAIDAFKQAEALDHSGQHACLIGLAYLRLEHWPQAELYFTACRERTPANAIPSWLVLAERELDGHLHDGRLAPITVRTAGAPGAMFGVSTFPADELFAPAIVHLPPGRHVITGIAPLHARVQSTITVANAKPQTVTLGFTDEPSRSRSMVPWIVGGAGVAALAAGGLYHAFAFAPVRDQLVQASDPMHPDPALYDRNSDSFDRRRALTIGLYAVGAVAVITGVTLNYTVYADGNVIGVEWKR